MKTVAGESAPDRDESAVKRLNAYLERAEQAVSEVLRTLYGEMPNWMPTPIIERTQRTIEKLISDGFCADGICQRVAEAEKNSLTFPGLVTDPRAFAQSIHELAHLRYAIALGKLNGLRELAGDQAELGQRFKNGRKPGSSGPIRRAIAKLLAQYPTMKNPDLWVAIRNKPPRGWQEREHARLGAYLEGPKHNMGYARFCTVCGEERKKLNGKITV